jgi:LAS superfamily LD-carboxypeptidase LdcB
MNDLNLQRVLVWGFGTLVLIVVGSGVYAYTTISSLSSRVTTLNQNVASLSTRLASSTDEFTVALDQQHRDLTSALAATQQKLGTAQQQIQSQVGTLQKLSQTDSQLLEKYSKVYFLNENYVPAHLSEIPLEEQYSDTSQLLIEGDVLPHLQSLITEASSTGVKLYVKSAYRSFAEQKALKSGYKVTYGAGTANSFSADQGYSEHQLGTTVDFITTGLNGNLTTNFDQTTEYAWLTQNAYRYGFVLSYPKNNTYYIYEPWHWRFVGVQLATDLHTQGKTFYSLDQRTIDTYLISLFD